MIEREQPDAILPTLGGQTALNLAVELAPLGIELIGADLEAIRPRRGPRALPRDRPRRRDPDAAQRRRALARGRVPACRRSSGRRSRSAARAAGSPGRAEELPRRDRARVSRRARSARCSSRSTSSGWQEHELEVMCDARGNAVVVCSIENLDPMGVHTGDSWTVAPQQTLPDPLYQQLREAAFATARAVGVATGGANVQFAVHPTSGRVPRDRDEPARLALLGARLEGDRLPDREARGAARGRLHARRAPERHHRQDDGGVRAGARLRRGQGAALRLREVPARARHGSAPRCGRSARRSASGGPSPRPSSKALEGREAPAVAFPDSDDELRRARRRAVPERWDLLLEAARRELELPGIHPYFADRLREVAARGAPVARATGAARRRFVRRRVRGADALLLRHPRGRGRGAGAVGARGDRARRRAEPDRAGDRVRLLLRPRRPGAAQARLRGGARQLEPRDGLDRLRHLRPALPGAARRAQRARGLRARAAGRRRRLVRRADAAAARSGARGGRGTAARRPARGDRRGRGPRPLRRARGRARAGVGRGRERRGGCASSPSGSAIPCSSGRIT